MQQPFERLRDHARRIWQAGVEGVRPERLLPAEIAVEGDWLQLGDWGTELDRFDRIVVVGGGKAAAGMAVGLEAALGPELLAQKQLSGWLNVPDGTIVPTQAIHLHAGRPAGVNEPRPEGVLGTREILRTVAHLGPRDLCICLLSGGGSALLPAPAAGVSLQQKLEVTQLLSAAGANIEQLNAVRRQISDIKGGGLARACRAGALVTLMISDVLGDPLEAIASGPTVASSTGPAEALAVLAELGLSDHPAAAPIVAMLQRKLSAPQRSLPAAGCEVHHVVLANNATAVDSAGMEAERLGYNHAMICSPRSEGPAEQVGRHLAEMAITMRDQPGPNCLISGGEPTVTLAPLERRGRGGRNQQLVLAAARVLGDCRGIALLSGGTDGEDGPTDAAGAWIDSEVAGAADAAGLDPADYLDRNDAYHYFQTAAGLLKTGPTHTNVGDLRVIVVDQASETTP